MLRALTREEPRDRRRHDAGAYRVPTSYCREIATTLPTGPRAAAALAIREGWPVLMTPFVIGVPFAMLARDSGLDPIQASGMSVLIFAGSSQFAALELFRSGAHPLLVVATVLLVNLRHLLMAASLRAHFGDRPLPQRLALAYLITDEAFAMGTAWYRRGGRALSYYVAFGTALWALWNLGTIVGALVGPAVPDPRVFGLDYAITAAFIAIVVIGVRDRRDILVALAAALAAGLLRGLGLGAVAVVVAGALAPLAVRIGRRP